MSSGEKFSKVVVAFDGSEDSVKAVRLASSLASEFGSEVIIAHVFSSPAVGFGAASGMPIPDYPALDEAREGSAKEILSRGLKLASDMGMKARGELIKAPSVVEALVDFAKNEDASLIVVGTRGMTGIKKLIIGSVSSGLVNHAPCPVLVAR